VARIAFDGRDAFVPMPHGSGVYVKRLLEALVAHAGAVAPQATTSSGGDVTSGGEAAVREADVHTFWPVVEGGRGPELLFEQLGWPRQLRALGADLVHGPDSFLPLRRPCPGVLTVHDLAFAALDGDMPRRTELKYRVLVPRCARSAQRVICPSEFTAADLERRYGIAREKLRVIPEAPALMTPSRPDQRREPPPGPYLLAAGDLRPKKNLGVLVQAFQRLVAAGYAGRLVLAGADLGMAGVLSALAPGAPLELTGFVSDAELDALIRGAEVVVVPGFYEGFGLVALDAMARGVPTVLARAGALPEVGADAARYFEPADVGELTDVLSQLLGSASRAAAVGAAGRARAAQFSWAAAAAATWQVYEELL
jgi:glycosyltransferase involved in cell wall biosynthesis